MKVNKICAYISIILFLLEVALILFSWIISVLAPSIPFSSILSPEGIRWFWGSFLANLLTPVLGWIILLSIAFGVFSSSGLHKALKSLNNIKSLQYSQRHALLGVLGLLIIILLIIVLLAFIPHAILLGVTGSLYPSAFASGFVPILAIIILLLGTSYGIVSGVFQSLLDVFSSFYNGLKASAPIIVVYLFAVQLYYSIVFVFFN